MLINRTIFTDIKKSLLGEPKVHILYGPRQAGKTTLIQEILKGLGKEAIFFNGDDLRTQDLFSQPRLDILKNAIGEKKMLVIDEAQRIENIGLTLKLIFDNLNIQILASGSSSFDLADKINEPLTGRTRTFYLYPLTSKEIAIIPPDTFLSRLENYLRFGMYPKVITTQGESEKENYLYEFINNYLYKDLLMFSDIRKPKKVIDLLSLLALQIGSEVVLSELAQNLSLSKTIVEKYLNILEKMFVIVNLCGFSRNLRKEISKTSKYYFLDLGVRNALIRNFNPLNLRNDKGALFENFCIIERQKALSNHNLHASFYFWRTYDQKEIDLIEERGGKITGYEFKWGGKERKIKANFREFTQAYPGSILQRVTTKEIESFLNTQ